MAHTRSCRSLSAEAGPSSSSPPLRPDDELATIVVRPRGWHLPEKHILVDGEQASGSLVDFALYLASSGQKQWIQGGFTLSNGQTVTRELVEGIVDEEMAKIAEAKGDAYAEGRWDEARATFAEMALAEEYADFSTLPAYERMQ